MFAGQIVALTAIASPLALSAEDVSGLCRDAAATASADAGVPYDVLLALSVTETGRHGQPWPWAIGIEGEGHWADSADEAATLAQKALDEGITNIDVGCFQVNVRWHSKAFRSIEDMLDPERNATYAARFLAEKFAETGDWSDAAAAYHSATPDRAEAYKTRFDATYANLGGSTLPGDPGSAWVPNRFPLLITGESGSAGSLVPLTAGGRRLIGEP